MSLNTLFVDNQCINGTGTYYSVPLACLFACSWIWFKLLFPFLQSSESNDSIVYTNVNNLMVYFWIQVTVIGGDMTVLDAEVLVNAANRELKHVGGLAAVIVNKGICIRFQFIHLFAIFIWNKGIRTPSVPICLSISLLFSFRIKIFVYSFFAIIRHVAGKYICRQFCLIDAI